MCEFCGAKKKFSKEAIESQDFQEMKKASEMIQELHKLCEKNNFPYIFIIKSEHSIITDLADSKHLLNLIGMNKYIGTRLETLTHVQQRLLEVMPSLIEEEQEQYAALVTKGPAN